MSLTALPIAVSGLMAQSFRAAEIAHNIVNVETSGFKSGEVVTVSIVAGGQGAGVQPRRRQSESPDAEAGGGGDTALIRQFAQLIETEIAYKADAKTVRAAEEMLGRLLDVVA